MHFLVIHKSTNLSLNFSYKIKFSALGGNFEKAGVSNYDESVL